jgi:hypothetical protein
MATLPGGLHGRGVTDIGIFWLGLERRRTNAISVRSKEQWRDCVVVPLFLLLFKDRVGLARQFSCDQIRSLPCRQ